MVKILKSMSIFLIFAFSPVFFIGQIVSAADWVENPANPIYDPLVIAEKAYFPSVLKIGDADYRMWYQSNSTPGNSTVAYATSTDGLSWVMVTNTVSGLIPNNAGHPHVEFADGKFRIWYWNTVSPYGNSAMHYADSVDGITWANDSAITGNLITSASGQWNSGSYGAVDVIVNDNPTNTSTNPFDYRYAMYYDATSGGYEQIALGYSADGINWTLYGTGPVLPKGPISSWDSGYATAGTVIHGSIWEMWYSGGVSASNEGIGYATSTDGLIWTKSVANPFMSKNDAVIWRNNRTYTPSVIKDGNFYKMWFTGRDIATGNYAVGYSTLAAPLSPVLESAIVAQPAGDSRRNYYNNSLTVLEKVNNDNGGAATYLDFPIFVNGNPFAVGETRDVAEGIYKVSEMNRAGYRVSFTGDCDANGVIIIGGTNIRDAVCTITNNDIGVVAPGLTPPLIDIVKIPSPLALPDGPGPVTYTYAVTNIGTVPMTDITLLGDICKPIVFVSGDTNNDSKLDVGEKWVYNCTQKLTETTKNTVAVIGFANGMTATHITNTTVVVGAAILPPLIHVTKVPDPLALPAGGGPVTYTIKVTNPGLVPLSNVGVSEDILGSFIHYVFGDTNGDSKLDPSETWVYINKVYLTKSTENTVVASGIANGFVATDFALATVLVAGDLSSAGAALSSLDLKLGVVDTSVRILQQYLNAHGYVLASSGVGSPGNETDYFGTLTKQALAKFQKDKGIFPATGYFGPLTRAYISSR